MAANGDIKRPIHTDSWKRNDHHKKGETERHQKELGRWKTKFGAKYKDEKLPKSQHIAAIPVQRWALGCVNPTSWLSLAMACELTKPRAHLIAQLCISNRGAS